MRSGESTDHGEHDLHQQFRKIMAALADGELTFRWPFDLATSAALAANIDHGQLAQDLFDVTAQRDTAYRVSIHAVAPDVPDREVINTTVPSTAMLMHLLDGLIAEYFSEEEGDPSGG